MDECITMAQRNYIKSTWTGCQKMGLIQKGSVFSDKRTNKAEEEGLDHNQKRRVMKIMPSGTNFHSVEYGQGAEVISAFEQDSKTMKAN